MAVGRVLGLSESYFHIWHNADYNVLSVALLRALSEKLEPPPGANRGRHDPESVLPTSSSPAPSTSTHLTLPHRLSHMSTQSQLEVEPLAQK